MRALKHLAIATIGAILLSSCAYNDGVVGDVAGANPGQELPTNWTAIATERDRERLSNWRTAFTEALRDAAAAGHANEIAAEGRLLRPDAGLADPRPPAGVYDCRFLKLGSQGSVSLSYVAYRSFRCRIDDLGDTVRLTKLTGSQRPVGTIYPDNRLRMVFLGVLELGDETRAHLYGRDETRDMIGAVERIDDNRWRIIFPQPRFESVTDVLELVPVG